MTYLDWEYDLYRRRRQRSRMESLRRQAFKWKLVSLALAVALCIALCGALRAHGEEVGEEPTETLIPVPEAVPAAAVTVIETQEAAPLTPVELAKLAGVPMDEATLQLLYDASRESGVEFALALAVVRQETDFRNITGDGGDSEGYMQIQKRWHAARMERLGVTDLMDPAGNFRVGCDYLAELLDKYPVANALTAYNSGKAGLSQYAEETLNYLEEYRAWMPF